MCDRSIGFPKVCLAMTASRILTEPHNLSNTVIIDSAQLELALLNGSDNAHQDEIIDTTDIAHTASAHTISN